MLSLLGLLLQEELMASVLMLRDLVGLPRKVGGLSSQGRLPACRVMGGSQLDALGFGYTQ